VIQHIPNAIGGGKIVHTTAPIMYFARVDRDHRAGSGDVRRTTMPEPHRAGIDSEVIRDV
jgi:hypothetical protein